jgi:hypothetical protein
MYEGIHAWICLVLWSAALLVVIIVLLGSYCYVNAVVAPFAT